MIKLAPDNTELHVYKFIMILKKFDPCLQECGTVTLPNCFFEQLIRKLIRQFYLMSAWLATQSN